MAGSRKPISINRRSFIGAAAALALPGLVRPGLARAETGFPSRPVKIIAPFPPAGAADIISRLVGEPLSRALGQPVLIDNRSGGGGRIGTEVAVHSAPDGYTLLMGSQATNSINPELYHDLSYDPARDLVPVALIGGVGSVLYVRNSLDITSLQQLIDRARERPGTFTFGSAGNGGGSHLAMALLEAMAGIHLVHVPYRGTAPATTDVLAGQIDMLCDPITTGLPHVQAGRVRALGVTTPQRFPGLPNVPTFAEAGVPGYEAVSYYGLYAPAGVSADVLAKLRAATTTALADPTTHRKLAEQGMIDLQLDPGQFAAYVAEDRRRWGRVIRDAGITPN